MARRRGALFLPLDVRFMEDERIDRAGERAAWLYLGVCLKVKQLEREGNLTRSLVGRLGIPGWQDRLRRCVEVDLLRVNDELVTVVAWLNHNDPAESTAARRTADAKRKRTARQVSDRSPSGQSVESERTGVTDSVGSPNVEGEGEGEGEPPYPPVGGATETKSKRRPARTALPDDWQPTAAMVQWARDRGWPDDAAKRQTERFREQAAATARRQVDWTASWRTWLIGEEGKPGWQRSSAAAAKPTGFHEDWMVVR